MFYFVSVPVDNDFCSMFYFVSVSVDNVEVDNDSESNLFRFRFLVIGKPQSV